MGHVMLPCDSIICSGVKASFIISSKYVIICENNNACALIVDASGMSSVIVGLNDNNIFLAH